MSKFEFQGNIEGETVVVGDGARVDVNSSGTRRAVDRATGSLNELAEQITACTDDIRAMELAIAELREELGREQRRSGRIRSLLSVLGTSAHTVAAVAVGVEKVRESIGHVA